MKDQQFSVVIMCKNEADVIGYLLQSVQGLTDDIVIYDNGSTDALREIAGAFNASLYTGKWEGYGKTRVNAVMLAKYDWILMLDADESLDEKARQSMRKLTLADNKVVYEFRFKNFYKDIYLRHGAWGNDSHIRLFNRCMVNCDLAIVHERIILSAGMKIKTLPGYILHRTCKNISDFSLKMQRYARLWAEKNFPYKHRYLYFKMYFSPPFAFIQGYFLKAGFMDGWPGFVCSGMSAMYTFLKYAELCELHRSKKTLSENAISKKVLPETLLKNAAIRHSL